MMKLFEPQYAFAVSVASFMMLLLAVLFVISPLLCLVVGVIGGLAILGHVTKVREQHRKELQYRKRTYGF